MSNLKRNNRLIKFTTLFLLFALMFTNITPVRVMAQDDKEKQKKEKEEKERQKKQAEFEKKQAEKQAKEEKLHKQIKDFSLDLYNKDPEFKDQVNDRYREVQSNHSQEAYLINTRNPNPTLVTRDEGKLSFENVLYDNPLAQDYVNRVGQSLVPANSNKLYAFRIIQNPVPEARSLSTGTVYVSTGYLATIDNEAQLAYILGHEIAHIEKDHWFEDVLVALGTQEYNEARQKKAKRWALIGTIAAAAVGGMAGGAEGSNDALGVALIAAPTIVKLVRPEVYVAWDKVQEDVADLEALKYMFDRNYDVREIPKFYERMAYISSDPRSQVGFVGNQDRIKERLQTYNQHAQTFFKAGAVVGALNLAEQRAGQNAPKGSLNSAKNLQLTGMRGIAKMINETLSDELKRRLDEGMIKASPEGFKNIMALVKRDNGIRAYYFDMFKMSLANLDDSIRVRENDPYIYFFYGKVLKQTAKSPADVSKALETMVQAIDLDRRQTLAEPYFYRAVLNLAANNPNLSQNIINDLKVYVDVYQRENAGALPPNMDVVYGIMQDFGVYDYRVSPAVNVATKDIAPIDVANSGSRTAQTTVTPETQPQPKVQPTKKPGKP
jgi:predicted Zn-dependent protease/cell division protein FtsL